MHLSYKRNEYMVEIIMPSKPKTTKKKVPGKKKRSVLSPGVSGKKQRLMSPRTSKKQLTTQKSSLRSI